MSAIRLSLSGVTLTLQGRRVLRSVDLDREMSGITCLMGPNGAGKSLFLRVVQGLSLPDSGTITWEGAPARATPTRRGFVFQTTPVLRRSVADNIGFPLRARGIERAEIETRVGEMLDRVRLTDKAQVPAARLSGGEMQRMAFGRALISAPEALLLDEPSASLDPASTRDLEDLIRQVSGEGVPVLMATHDIAQARRLADRVLFFSDGKLVEDAASAAFFRTPASAPAQAYLEGRLTP